MGKKLFIIDGCEYCPYLEKLQVNERTKKNPLISADFYKCNKLKLCVESTKTYLPKPLEHLYRFCPLPNYDEDDNFDEPIYTSSKKPMRFIGGKK